MRGYSVRSWVDL